MGRRKWIVLGCVLTALGFAVYAFLAPPPLPPDLEVQGKESALAERVAWIGLATGLIGLLTALLALVKEILALRRK